MNFIGTGRAHGLAGGDPPESGPADRGRNPQRAPRLRPSDILVRQLRAYGRADAQGIPGSPRSRPDAPLRGRVTVEELRKIRERVRKATSLREGAGRAKVTVHMGTCGIAAGARKIMSALLALMQETDTTDVILTTSGCAGLCSREPMATVELEGEAPVKYVDLTEEKTRRIFLEHVVGGKTVTEYAIAIGSERVS